MKAYPTFANKTFANRTFAIGECPLYFRQYTPTTFANWRMSIVISPIYPYDFRQLANVHCTFANITCELAKSLSTSLVMETNKMHPDTLVPHMQPTFIFACDNSKESAALSSIYPLDFRQLAKVHCTFANIPPRLSPIGECPLYFRQ